MTPSGPAGGGSGRLFFDIPPFYRVEIEGGVVRVFSDSKHAKGRELSQNKTQDGYLRVKMNNKPTRIHRLVAQHYLGPRPEGKAVNHIDGNKLNNDPSNLEYVTWAENIAHSIRLGLHVACNPERSGRYIDGRCADRRKYKHDWYMKNRDRLLKRSKEAYRRRCAEAQDAQQG